MKKYSDIVVTPMGPIKESELERSIRIDERDITCQKLLHLIYHDPDVESKGKIISILHKLALEEV